MTKWIMASVLLLVLVVTVSYYLVFYAGPGFLILGAEHWRPFKLTSLRQIQDVLKIPPDDSFKPKFVVITLRTNGLDKKKFLAWIPSQNHVGQYPIMLGGCFPPSWIFWNRIAVVNIAFDVKLAKKIDGEGIANSKLNIIARRCLLRAAGGKDAPKFALDKWISTSMSQGINSFIAIR